MISLNNRLENAAKLVTRCISSDPVIQDVNKHTYNLTQKKGEVFELRQKAIIPQAIFEEYQNMQYKCFMGIFPDVHRCWISIDNKIFLWSYMDHTDFNVFDELDQIIISAGLVKPKKGIFKDYVQYLLVLATPVEVVILALIFDNQGRDLKIVPTNYSVATDNVNMLSIKGTKDGRIFMCGGDGNLYELQYSSESSFFRSNTRKINHSKSLLGVVFSSIVARYSENDPIIDCVIDNTRNFIYTLTQKSKIQLWELGENDAIKLQFTYSTFETDAKYKYDGSPKEAALNLVSIHPIYEDESSEVSLVAVAASGDRYYFRGSKRSYGDSFEMKHIRHLKFNQENEERTDNGMVEEGASYYRGLRQGTQRAPRIHTQSLAETVGKVHEAFYCNGVLLLADSTSDDTDQLLCISSDTLKDSVFSNIISMNSHVCEKLTTLYVHGKSLALAEIPLRSDFDVRDEKATPESRYVYNELATQHVRRPREFVCLSNNGVQLLIKYRPVDVLAKLLNNSTTIEDQSLLDFFREYGRDEACCMCLMIACSQNVPRRYQEFQSHNIFITEQLTRNAEDALLKHGGKPEKPTNSSHTKLTHGGPVVQQGISFSASHNGLYMYFSRIVAPLWNKPIILVKNANERPTFQVNDILNNEQLTQRIRHLLVSLRTFLDKYPALHQGYLSNASQPLHRQLYGESRRGQLYGGLVHLRQEDHMKHLEQQSINGLYEMCMRSIQVLSFMSLLNAVNFNQLNTLQEQDKPKLKHDVIFSELLLTKTGQDALKEVVCVIIQNAEKLQFSMNDIFNILERDCKSYFNPADIKEFAGFMEMKNAIRSHTFKESRDHLRRALQHYKQIAPQISIETVCNDFQSLQFYEGAVELALGAARELDPLDEATKWHKNPNAPLNSDGAELFKRRQACYQTALKILDELYEPEHIRVDSKFRNNMSSFLKPIPLHEKEKRREHILNKMKHSNDELFLESLHDWILKRKDSQRIYQNMDEGFEHFLLERKDHQRLANFYQQTRQYSKAAEQFEILSESTSSTVDLPTRLASLSTALSCGKASDSMPTAQLQLYQDKLDVAQVQLSLLERFKERLQSIQNHMSDEPIDEFKSEIAALNQRLYTIRELYQLALRFELWESCLEIIDRSKNRHKISASIIQKCWIHIMTNMVERSLRMGSVTNIQSRLSKLRTGLSSDTFPVPFIVSLLEKLLWLPHLSNGQNTRIANGLQSHPDLFINSLLKLIGVPLTDRYDAYYSLFLYLSSHDSMLFKCNGVAVDLEYVLPKGQSSLLHVLRVLIDCLSEVKSSSYSTSPLYLHQDIVHHLERIASCLNQFPQSPMTQPLIESLESVTPLFTSSTPSPNHFH